MLEMLSRKSWLSIAILFVVTLMLTAANPFGIELIGAKAFIYSIPFTLVSIFILTEPVFSAKSTSPAEKRAILYEQIFSILRKVITIIGAFMALGVLDKIPLIGNLQSVLLYIAENWTVSIEALETLVGLALGIIGQFSNNTRFEVRALVNPRKINL